jgi:CDP-diacylglycerol---glycerol-3-phosphate 3-phosphatidyltransferase
VLAAFVMVTSLMVSYTRARAEALIGSCKVGFMERPERVVLIILGALFDRWGVMAPVLWVLAVLSTVTVIHRISYTYQRTKAIGPVRVMAPVPIRSEVRGDAREVRAESLADAKDFRSAPQA